MSAGTSACRSTGTKPGATVFTVIPDGASSRAQLRVRPICALLAVAYADLPGGGWSATSESMCTMRPYRRACIPGSTAAPSSPGLLTRKFSWARWSAQATWVTPASGCGPVALRTSTSTGPKRPVIAAISSATCCWSVTSAQNASATPPSCSMLRATFGACRSPRRPLTATARPSCARRRAVVAPRPRELPVTKATRPCATGMWRSFHSVQRIGPIPRRAAECGTTQISDVSHAAGQPQNRLLPAAERGPGTADRRNAAVQRVDPRAAERAGSLVDTASAASHGPDGVAGGEELAHLAHEDAERWFVGAQDVVVAVEADQLAAGNEGVQFLSLAEAPDLVVFGVQDQRGYGELRRVG